MPEGGSTTGIEGTDWAVVGARLTAFAVWLLRNRLWAARASDNAGLGRSAEDLASEAIADVLCGRCSFDPERGDLDFEGPLFFANASYLEDEVLARLRAMPELRAFVFAAEGINELVGKIRAVHRGRD